MNNQPKDPEKPSDPEPVAPGPHPPPQPPEAAIESRVRAAGVTMVEAVAGWESGFRKANAQARAMLAGGPAHIG